MDKAMLDIVRVHPLFSALPEKSLQSVLPYLRLIKLKAGQVLFSEGDPYDGLYIVVRGMFSIRQKTDWGERELCTVHELDMFGEMEALNPSARVASLLALVDSSCLHLAAGGFDRLVELEPSFILKMSRELIQRIRKQDAVVSAELYKSYRALTFALANLTDSRDPETGSHLARTRTYCAILAERLSRLSDFRPQINADFIDQIYNLSPLHDIGKVAVPDAILRKPGALDENEFEIMKTHTIAGGLAFDQALHESDNYLFRMGKRICLYHHERWDGAGYPEGLQAEAIPIEARIMALADVYDALLSKRVYKDAFSFERAALEISLESGRAFDPRLSGVMLDHIQDFQAVHQQYSDSE